MMISFNNLGCGYRFPHAINLFTQLSELFFKIENCFSALLKELGLGSLSTYVFNRDRLRNLNECNLR